jgi:hypothetical protein
MATYDNEKPVCLNKAYQEAVKASKANKTASEAQELANKKNEILEQKRFMNQMEAELQRKAEEFSPTLANTNAKIVQAKKRKKPAMSTSSDETVSQNSYHMGIRDALKYVTAVKADRNILDLNYMRKHAGVTIKNSNLQFLQNITGHRHPKAVFLRVEVGYTTKTVICLNKTLLNAEKKQVLARMLGYYLYTLNHGIPSGDYVFVYSEENTAKNPTDDYAEGVGVFLEKHIKLRKDDPLS